MKRFRFRLESILNLRVIKERQGREKLSAALQALNAADARLAAVHRRRAELAEALCQGRQLRFRPDAQVAGGHALDRLATEAAQAAAEREQALQARQVAYDAWLESRRQLQVLERLAERDRHAHHQHLNRVEQAELDEIASLAAARPASWS